MKSGPLLSVVVPVYNVRDYLEQCLNSILAQTYQNIELVLISNGPTDGSDAVCKAYAARDQRIKLIEFEENRGVAGAWRCGVRNASGSYIMFADADDFVDPDFYQQMMACRGNYDLVVSRWIREDGDKTRVALDPLALGPYTTQAEMEFLWAHIINISEPGGRECLMPGIAPFPWHKLYKADLLQTVFEEIQEDIPVSMDAAFVYRYILQCSSMLMTDICGYHYRIRENSNCHYIPIDRVAANACTLYHTLAPVFEAHPQHDVLMLQLQKKIARMLREAPNRMGFLPQARNKTLVFPFLNLLDGKRVVLYGAGLVGQSYWRQIRRLNCCELVLWSDREWEYRRKEGWPVDSLDSLAAADCDCVVIAAFRKDTADQIKQGLTALGIEERKLLWREPILL